MLPLTIIYTVEARMDGTKYVHYLADVIEDGDYPDVVVDEGTYEEYDSYSGTSYDITEYTFLCFDVGTWDGEDSFDEMFAREAPLVQQYMGRVYDTEAERYVNAVLESNEWHELNVCDVDSSTPCGNYWC